MIGRLTAGPVTVKVVTVKRSLNTWESPTQNGTHFNWFLIYVIYTQHIHKPILYVFIFLFYLWTPFWSGSYFNTDKVKLDNAEGLNVCISVRRITDLQKDHWLFDSIIQFPHINNKYIIYKPLLKESHAQVSPLTVHWPSAFDRNDFQSHMWPI